MGNMLNRNAIHGLSTLETWLIVNAKLRFVVPNAQKGTLGPLFHAIIRTNLMTQIPNKLSKEPSVQRRPSTQHLTERRTHNKTRSSCPYMVTSAISPSNV